MSIDIAEVLLFLRPNASFSVNGNSYEGIIWHDAESSKPSLEEVHNSIDNFRFLKAKKQKKEQVFYTFQEKKSKHKISLNTPKYTHSFLFDYQLLTRLDSHLLHRGNDALYLWVKSEEGLARLNRKEVEELSCLMQKFSAEIEVLIGYNMEALEGLSSLEELQNFQIEETLPIKYR